MNDSLRATSLCTTLKRRLERKDGLLVPGVPNALLARMVEDAGFEAVYLTGAGLANAHLGVPDIGLTTLTELAEHVTAIRDAVSLPLIVDADTGCLLQQADLSIYDPGEELTPETFLEGMGR